MKIKIILSMFLGRTCKLVMVDYRDKAPLSSWTTEPRIRALCPLALKNTGLKREARGTGGLMVCSKKASGFNQSGDQLLAHDT